MDDKKMKICMLGHKYVPSRAGGIEVVVGELSTRMAQLGHSVTCYNRNCNDLINKNYRLPEKDEYKGVKVKTVFTINKRGAAAVSASFSAALMAAFGNYDVVHFHAEGPCAMMWIPKLFGKKCIATIHGLDHHRAKWGRFARTYIMLGEKTAVKYADEIIVLSKGVQKYFYDTYGRETKFIPNGVNRPNILKSDLIKKKFGLDKDSYILYLGRIVPEKGLRYLVEAFKGVKTDKKLVIAGNPSDTDKFFDEIKQMSREDKRIIFTGFVQGKLLAELFSNAYIYVLPSDLEGMPLSLLEAMSYGNCCIVSDIEECSSVVEDKAIVFKKSNVEDLRDKLQKSCDDEDIVRRYKKGAADYICRKYSWDSVVDRTLKLYR